MKKYLFLLLICLVGCRDSDSSLLKEPTGVYTGDAICIGFNYNAPEQAVFLILETGQEVLVNYDHYLTTFDKNIFSE